MDSGFRRNEVGDVTVSDWPMRGGGFWPDGQNDGGGDGGT